MRASKASPGLWLAWNQTATRTRQRQYQSQQLCDAWLRRIAIADGATVRATIRDLRSPLRAEIAIANLIVESCDRMAARLIDEGGQPPSGDDIWDTLTRRKYQQLAAEQERQATEERERRYRESDLQIARMREERMKAGET